jgi:tRNA-splicing ligase RtcB
MTDTQLRWDDSFLIWIDELDYEHKIIRCPSSRGVAEEAPGAYKDVNAVVNAADKAGLARKVASLKPVVCIKG